MESITEHPDVQRLIKKVVKLEASNKEMGQEVKGLETKVKQLNKILDSYRVQYKAAIKAASLCRDALEYALEDEITLKGGG